MKKSVLVVLLFLLTVGTFLFAKPAFAAKKTTLKFGSGGNLSISLCIKHGLVCDWTLFDAVGMQNPPLSDLESCGFLGETGTYQQTLVKNKATFLIPIADAGYPFCKKKDGATLWLSSDKARVEWKLSKIYIFSFQKPTIENGYVTMWNRYYFPKLEFIGEELRLTVYSDFMAMYGIDGVKTIVPEDGKLVFNSNVVGWDPGFGVAAGNFVVSSIEPDSDEWLVNGYGHFSFPKSVLPSQDTGLIRFGEMVLPLDKLDVGPNLHVIRDGTTGFLWLKIGD